MMGSRSSRPLLGIALMMACGLAFVLLDSTAKHLVRSYPVVEVVWARYFFSLVTVLTLRPRYGLFGLVGTTWLDLQAGSRDADPDNHAADVRRLAPLPLSPANSPQPGWRSSGMSR